MGWNNTPFTILEVVVVILEKRRKLKISKIRFFAKFSDHVTRK